MQTDPLKKLIERRSPEWQANAAEWQFLRVAVEGGPGYVDGNLFKYQLEEATIYADRKQRAADNHFNLPCLVLDAYEGYLFQVDPMRGDGLPECVLAFLDAADQEGNDIGYFARNVARWMMGMGIVWVCVDKPSVSEAPANALQEREQGIAPYAYIVHPTHILDGKIERGEIVWLLVQEDTRDDDDPMTSTGETYTRWRLWERDRWRLFEAQKTTQGDVIVMVDEGVNTLGVVPFVPFRYSTGSGFASAGLINDIAHLDRAIFNKASQLDEIHYRTTFPQLAVPHKGDLYRTINGPDGDTVDVLTGAGQAMLTMGLATVIPYHTESGAPSFIVASTEPAKELARSIEVLTHQALSMALLDGEMGKDHASSASGVSKAYTFEKLNKRLASIGDTLEAGLQKVCELVCLWQGEPQELPQVLEFPDTYEVRSLAQEVVDALSLQGLGVTSPTFIQQLQKTIVRKALPNLDDDLQAQIDAEIEAGENAMWDEDAEELAEQGKPDNETGLTDDSVIAAETSAVQARVVRQEMKDG